MSEKKLAEIQLVPGDTTQSIENKIAASSPLDTVENTVPGWSPDTTVFVQKQFAQKIVQQTVAQSVHRPGVHNDFIVNDQTVADYLAIGKNAHYNIDLLTKTDDVLFSLFRGMATTFLSKGALKDNINKMIDQMRSEGTVIPNSPGSAVRYSDQSLTDAVVKHPSTKKFLNSIGAYLHGELIKTKGNYTTINIKQSIASPKFNSFWKDTVWGGLTIAINDVWAYDVELVGFTTTPFNHPLRGITGHDYSAKVRIKIYDHFGLDRPDIEDNKPASKHAGFHAWYILQHLRGYKPFITEVIFTHTFTGFLPL